VVTEAVVREGRGEGVSGVAKDVVGERVEAGAAIVVAIRARVTPKILLYLALHRISTKKFDHLALDGWLLNCFPTAGLLQPFHLICVDVITETVTWRSNDRRECFKI